MQSEEGGKMSRTILAEVDGFTPVIDEVVKATSLMSAVVFGRIWRFCQMPDGVCNACLEKISEDIGIDKATVMRHAKILVDAGYLEDLSPDLRNHPHTYKDTGKAALHMAVSSVAHCNAGVAENNASVAESKLKIDFKTDSKRIKHIEKPDFVNLTVNEALRLPELRIFRDTTGKTPGCGQWETVWNTIREMNGKGNAKYLRPFWLEWSSRGYNTSNLNWLTEWATAGEIPPKNKPNSHPAKGNRTDDLAALRRNREPEVINGNAQ
jgi:DNA-binding transcriptional ArsR family regulator